MGISTAHIFYIPVIFLVGVFAGFFLGRRAAEQEARKLEKRRKRREQLRKKKAEAAESDAATGSAS